MSAHDLDTSRLWKTWFLRGTAMFLLITAGFKLLSVVSEAPVLAARDPLLSWLTQRQVLFAAALMETGVAYGLLRRTEGRRGAWLVLWLVGVFGMCRIGLKAIGFQGHCPCLGHVLAWLPGFTAWSDPVMVGALVVMGVGGLGVLATRGNRTGQEGSSSFDSAMNSENAAAHDKPASRSTLLGAGVLLPAILACARAALRPRAQRGREPVWPRKEHGNPVRKCAICAIALWASGILGPLSAQNGEGLAEQVKAFLAAPPRPAEFAFSSRAPTRPPEYYLVRLQANATWVRRHGNSNDAFNLRRPALFVVGRVDALSWYFTDGTLCVWTNRGNPQEADNYVQSSVNSGFFAVTNFLALGLYPGLQWTGTSFVSPMRYGRFAQGEIECRSGRLVEARAALSSSPEYPRRRLRRIAYETPLPASNVAWLPSGYDALGKWEGEEDAWHRDERVDVYWFRLLEQPLPHEAFTPEGSHLAAVKHRAWVVGTNLVTQERHAEEPVPVAMNASLTETATTRVSRMYAALLVAVTAVPAVVLLFARRARRATRSHR